MIELADGRLYLAGVYEARVVSNLDPENKNRIRVRVFALHDDNTPDSALPYARACQNTNGNNTGEKKRPNEGVIGWVMFEKGDADHPVWIGSPLEPGDAISESRTARIDGDDTIEVKRDRAVTVDENETKTIAGTQTTTVRKQATHTYEDLEQIVIDGLVYKYGRVKGEVEGDAEETINGSHLFRILGHRKLTVAESMEISIGGSERRFIVQQMVMKASNATGLPVQDAMLFEAINGRLKAVAKTPIGIEGASFTLDPLGLQTQLNSTGALTMSAGAVASIEAPAVRVGPAGTAVVPVCTLPHTHLVFGVPTLPATPGPGTPLTVLGPAA